MYRFCSANPTFFWRIDCEVKMHVWYILQIIEGIVEDCLNRAEDQGLTSISFPAIGTGNLGFPKDLVASVMMEAVSKFNKEPRCLKTVNIVLYPKDQETIQVKKYLH